MTKKWFSWPILLNVGQKYCRMEHSAILLTFIKLEFVIKVFVLSIFEMPFYTGFTVHLQLGTCICTVRVVNTGNTNLFSKQITNDQSKFLTDNAMNCAVIHSPVNKSIQLICQREATRTSTPSNQNS